MKYCTNCIQTDTRPGIKFTETGLCPACNYHNNTRDIDWESRYETLQDVVKEYKKDDGSWDCIIGVSGGKDSTRQALWARDKLGLNPLLVCLGYPPQQVTDRGVNNISNLIELGFDVVVWTIQPETYRKLIRNGFLEHINWAKPSEQAIISSVPNLALKYDIKLILWGENPGLQLGDLKTLGKTGYDGNNLRYMNTVAGGGLEYMLEAGFERKNLIPYLYPHHQEFDEAGLQIIYLGWFWNDWSIINNGTYASSYGLELRDDGVKNTGDLWGVFSLDEDWVTLNQMIKYYKFGFGRVSDYCNEAIRLGNMTREDGIKLAEKYDDSCSPEYIKNFCEYIDIPISLFWDKVYGSVNKDLFNIDNNGKIERKFKVGLGL
jgi:N-acetyl sugar amidotransferase